LGELLIVLEPTSLQMESMAASASYFHPQKIPCIHLLLPAFNESKSITKVIKQALSIMNAFPYYRITLIDDGSTDNTVNQVREQFPHVEIIKDLQNMGKGSALRRGLREIGNNEIVVFMDADGEHQPEDLPKLLLPILNGEADIVIGSRFHPNQEIPQKSESFFNNGKSMNQIRFIGNRLFSLLTLLGFGKYLSDTQCGFRVFAPHVLKQIPLYSKGFQIEIETILQALQRGLRIIEIPIGNGKARHGSYIRLLNDGLKIFFLIIEFWLPPHLKYL
jgi:glycosyltransferase involved in cell wall biosynthesis